MTRNFKDGDVFYWRWIDFNKSGHCCSWKAIYKNGQIVDQFWHGGDLSKSWTPENYGEHIKLEFKGNFDDLEAIYPYDAQYYEDEEITDLRHSNSSSAKVYKRIGAKRSKEKMIELLKYAKDDYQRAANSYEETAAQCHNSIIDIENGADIDKIYVPVRSK